MERITGQGIGHEVVLLNARYVKGFVVGNMNDFNDAQAIHEAVLRPNKRVVKVKITPERNRRLYWKMLKTARRT